MDAIGKIDNRKSNHIEINNFRTNILNKIKKMKVGEKVTFDIANIDPTELQKIVKELKGKVSTYISSGNLVIQK